MDFTFENLLDLTAVALFEALNEEEKIGMDVELEFTDDEEKAKDTVEDHLEEDPEHYSRLKSVFEHDVWDEETNKLVDPSLLEDNEESKASENDEQYMPDVYNIDPYPHRHEFIDNVCVICDYVLKATEIYTEEDEIKRLDKQNNELAGILSRMNASKIEMLKIDIRWEQKRLEDIENNIHPDEFYELYNERVKAQLLSHSKRKLESKKQELKELTGESKAIEGGRGSGRKGHQKWMLGAEADPEECPNCMIFTEKKNGNCQICGNSY